MTALERAATVEQAAQAVLAHARATLGASAGVVMRRSADGLSLETVGATGHPAGALDARIPLSRPVPLVTAVRTGEPVLLQTPQEALRAGYTQRAEDLQLGYGAWAALPLKAQARVIGALELSFMGDRPFGEDDRAWLLVLAAQCAQALDRAQLRAGLECRERQLADALLPLVHDQASTGTGTILSGREQEVLRLLVEGLNNREIADRLGLAVPTVKTHVDHVCEKLEVSGTMRARVLAARAIRLGLVPVLGATEMRD
jgi:DNA-binding CsgD family transcriptional regulator